MLKAQFIVRILRETVHTLKIHRPQNEDTLGSTWIRGRSLNQAEQWMFALVD